MAGTGTRTFRLGEWLVEPDMNRLSAGDSAEQIEPKTMEVLVYLCERPGEVVSADELIAAVWGGRPMGDNPVYKSIAKLRRALGDDSASPSFILTVPKKGYRLVGPVVLSDAASAGGDRRGWWRLAAPLAAGLVIGLGLAAAVLWRPPSEPTRLMPISTFAGSHTQPSFAPDGERFAFVNDADGVAHVWISGSGELPPRQLTFGSTPNARPRWSPTGDTVLLMRGGSVWAVSAEGGEPVELLRDALNPNWSRDGERIVFERRYGVWLADADGGNQRNLSAIAQSELALSPRWPAFGPNGDRIVFFEAAGSPEGDLWVLDLETNGLEKLTNAPAFGGAPVWSPDGSEIVYSSQRGGSRTLWSVDPRERSSRALLIGSGDDDFPDISADGSRIIYSNSRERFQIVRSDAESGAERILHESRLTIVGPELSPDGRTIAFFGPAPAGGIQLFTLGLASGSVNALTDDPAATHALPRWSHDGEHLYFFYSKSDASYARMAATGGEIETVAAGWNWNVANGASVDPTGARIMYSRLDGQAPVQTSIRHVGRAEDRGFGATLEYPRWSRDGMSVVGSMFTNQRFPGNVAVCTVVDEECHTIAERARVPMWSADETRVFFVRGFGRRQELFVSNADGAGTERKLFEMGPLLPLGPFYAVTPEDAIVWIRHERDPGAIWVIGREVE